jgi:hypothetical protein
MRDVETTSWALRVDSRVFVNNMNAIVPMPVEEMVPETGTSARDVWALIHWAWTGGEVRREVDSVELTRRRMDVGHIPVWRRFQAVLSPTVEGEGAFGKSLDTLRALRFVAEAFTVGWAQTCSASVVGRS